VKIYFAGPLFATYERGFIDECAAMRDGRTAGEITSDQIYD
jgi:hypothetical protein